jgi:hypothetical protein
MNRQKNIGIDGLPHFEQDETAVQMALYTQIACKMTFQQGLDQVRKIHMRRFYAIMDGLPQWCDHGTAPPSIGFGGCMGRERTAGFMPWARISSRPPNKAVWQFSCQWTHVCAVFEGRDTPAPPSVWFWNKSHKIHMLLRSMTRIAFRGIAENDL